MSKEDLQEMISNDRIEDVIKILLQKTKQDGELYPQVLGISAALKNLQRKVNTGELSYSEQMSKRSQITNGLLNIVNQLEDEEKTQTLEASSKAQPSITKSQTKASTPKIKIPNWILGILGLALALLAFRPLIFQIITPDFQRVVINLHGSQGILDNPLKKGVVSIAAVEADFRDQAPLGTDGHAVFDSVPIALLGKKMVFSLSSSPGYVLKNPNEEYILAEKINVALKKVEIRDTTTTTIKCPTTTPNNLPLGSDKPSGTRRGSTAVAGYYRVENGKCKWIPAHWQKNDISDCPSQPPSGVENMPTHKSGYTWISGYYIKKDGQCEWVYGYWRVQSVPPEQAGNCPSQPPNGISNVPAPRTGYTWVKGYYVKENGQCRWIDGYWRVQSVPPPKPN